MLLQKIVTFTCAKPSNMKRHLVIFSLLLSGLMVKAQSQTPTPTATTGDQASGQNTNVSKGFGSVNCVELGGSISLNSQSVGGYESSVFIFSPFIGWFVAKGFELGFDPLSITASDGSTSFLVLFAPSYNFLTGSNSKMYPFIEGDIGMNYEGSGGGSESGLSAGGRVGFKIEIVKHALLNISLQYLRNNQGSHGLSNNTGNLVLGAGFTVYF